MEFCDFAQALYPHLSKGETEGEFVRTLLINVVDDEYPDTKGPYMLDEVSLRHYFNGTRKMSRIAKGILGNLDTNKFVAFVQSFNDDVQQQVFDALFSDCPNLESHSFAVQSADLFADCLKQCALIKPGRSSAAEAGNRLVIEDGLRRLVSRLAEIDEPENLVQLRYDVVKVARKIDAYPNQSMNKLLTSQITEHVIQFYRFIQEQIGLLEDASQLHFETIANAVQYHYATLKAQNVDAVTVYYKTRNWIQAITKCDDELACEIMVSFFVQNCEVFDAPSE